MRMRLACLTALAAIAAAPALAADFPTLRGTNSPSLPPPPLMEQTPYSTWDGFYIGGLVGYSQTDIRGNNVRNTLMSQASTTNSVAAAVGGAGLPAFAVPDLGDRRSSFGGFVGYNLQLGEVVVGVEADYMSIRGNAVTTDTFVQSGGVTTFQKVGSVEARLHDMFTLRGRAGYALGNFMPYVTAGLAVGRGSTRSTASATIVNGTTGVVQSSGDFVDQRKDSISAGFTVGAGVEATFGGLLLRGEYIFARLQQQSSSHVDVNQFRAGAGVKF